MTTAPTKISELEERCEYAQEVLGRAPAWLVRCGTGVVFAVLALVAWLSWVVRYPDVVPARIVLVTQSPPVRIVAPVAGNIERLRVGEQDVVAAGDLLATIDNAADTEAVLRLRAWIHQTRSDRSPALALGRHVARERLALGDLQGDFAALQRAYDEHQFGVELRAVERETQRVMAERAQYDQLIAQQQQQASTLDNELRLLEADFARVQELYTQKLLPRKSVDDKERELLQLRRASATSETERTQTQIKLAELDKTLEQLRITQQRDTSQHELGLTAAYQKLLGAVDEWDKRYALRAPQAGRVSFAKSSGDRRFVAEHEEVATLVPDAGDAVVGRMAMPEHNSGKVKVGQPVYIRLDGFPFQEFGIIEGRVKQIALVPRDGQYAIDVELPKQLTTSFRRKLDLRQEMQGSADIVTDDLRIIERVFYQFRKIAPP